LGASLLGFGRLEEAIGSFEDALREPEADPTSETILVALGDAYHRSGDDRNAIRRYLEAAQATTDRLRQNLDLAHDLVTRDTALAIRDWIVQSWLPSVKAAGISGAERVKAVVFVGRICLYADQPTQALALYEEANTLAPSDARVAEGLGQALGLNGRPEDGLRHLDRAQQLATLGTDAERVPAIVAKRIHLLCQLGKWSEALSELTATSDLDAPFATERAIYRAKACLGLGLGEDALKVTNEAVSRSPDQIEALAEQALALVATGNYLTAVETVDAALQRDPTRKDLLLAKAQTLIEGQVDLEWGRRLLEKYAHESSGQEPPLISLPDGIMSPQHRYFRAELLRAFRRPKDALAEVDAALADPSWSSGAALSAPAHELKASLLEHLGRDGAAEELVQSGIAYYFGSNYRQADSTFTRASSLKSDVDRLHWYWSDAVRVMGSERWPEVDADLMGRAITIWDEGYRIRPPDPGETWPYVARARCLDSTLPKETATDRLMEARTFLERGLAVEPNNATALSFLGRYSTQLGLFHCSAMETGHAVEISPEDPFARMERATALANIGDPGVIDAINKYAQTLTQPDSFVDSVWGYALFHQGKLEEALEHCNKAVEGRPQSQWNRALRAGVLRQLRREDEAIADYRLVWEMDVAESNIDLISKAWAGVSLGHYAEADKLSLEELRRLPQFDANVFYPMLNLGCSALGAGDSDAAEHWFTNAIRRLNRLSHVLDGRSQLREMPFWQVSGDRQKFESALPGYTRLLEEAAVKMSHYEHPEDAAIAELSAVRDTLFGGPFNLTAAVAGVARLDCARREWLAAMRGYRRLMEKQGRFPEGVHAISRCMQSMCDEGDALMRSVNYTGAAKIFRDALEFAPMLAADDLVVFRAHISLASALIFAGDGAEGTQQIRAALERLAEVRSTDWIAEQIRGLLQTELPLAGVDEELRKAIDSGTAGNLAPAMASFLVQAHAMLQTRAQS